MADKSKSKSVLVLLFEILRNPHARPSDVWKKVGISKDQYYRYLKEFDDIIPIYYDQSRKCYDFHAPIRLGTLLHRPEELVSFMLLLSILSQKYNIHDSKLVSNMEKMLGIGSDIEILKKYLVELEEAGGNPDFVNSFTQMCQGIIARRRVKFAYTCGKGEGLDIEIEPYRILHQGEWYVRGLSLYKKELRNYRIQRMKQVEILQTPFTMPESVDEGRVSNSWDFGDGPPEQVKIIFDKSCAFRLQENRIHPSQRLRTLADGRIELTLMAKTSENMIPFIMGFGARAQVVEPVTLVERLKAELLKTFKMYEDTL